MRAHPVHLLVTGAIVVAACTSSPGLLPLPGDTAVPLYDDLTGGSISGTRWDTGEYSVTLSGQAAVLTEAVTSVRPSGRYVARLVAIPPAGGQVTTFQADVSLTSAVATGDSLPFAGIELMFQPSANRLQHPYGLTNALLARVGLQKTGSSVVAQRTVFEFLPETTDCSALQGIGTALSSNWGLNAPASAGTRYTISITVDPARKVFTFKLKQVGGALDLSHELDVSGVTTASAPFVPDLSATNFYRAALAVGAAGGVAGGGDASAAAVFDDVLLGMDGAPAALFDDFASGTRFDAARWTLGGASAASSWAGIVLRLLQADAPAAAAMNLTRTSGATLQADVTVGVHEATGPGRIAAELTTALYNDGTNGSGIAPDVNARSSQVGDVLAVVAMTSTEASHAVIRCDSALCSRFTFVEPPTLLGAVAQGTTHTLSARWEAARHTVVFRLDGHDEVLFDPVAAGLPVTGEPRTPWKRIGVQAGPAGPSEPFASGLAGSLTATFANVRTE